MKTLYSRITTYRWASTSSLLLALALLSSACDSDDPKPENVEETITKVTLTFTPEGGATSVTATAEDPDDDGPKDLEVKDTIRLKGGTEYTLSIDLVNGLAKEGEEGYSVTEEVQEEGDEHQFFFAWTGNVFSDPDGDGNVGKDNRNDPVRYDDKDGDNRPIGLRTKWKTLNGFTGDASNTFRVMLKHQPDGIKTDSSTSEDGESDIDLTFQIQILQ